MLRPLEATPLNKTDSNLASVQVIQGTRTSVIKTSLIPHGYSRLERDTACETTLWVPAGWSSGTGHYHGLEELNTLFYWTEQPSRLLLLLFVQEKCLWEETPAGNPETSAFNPDCSLPVCLDLILCKWLSIWAGGLLILRCHGKNEKSPTGYQLTQRIVWADKPRKKKVERRGFCSDSSASRLLAAI